MATARFILKEPYKKAPARDKAGHPQEGQEVLNGTKTGKKRTKSLNPDETRLYCVLIIDRYHIIKIKTEHKMFPKEWDFKIQGKKEVLAGSPEFNKGLKELKEKFLNKYRETIKQAPDMPFKQVASVLIDYGKKIEVPFSETDKSFFDRLEEYKSFLEGEVAPGTIKKYVTLEKSLKDFVSKNKTFDPLSFSLIDHSFKDAFVKYLRTQKPRGRQKSRSDDEELQTGLLIDTEGKYIECLKTFCKWAEERGYNNYLTYRDFKNFEKGNIKRRKHPKDIVTLSLPELKHFYTFDFSDKPHLDRVRDLFCFGAYTVQRWSDIQRFDKSQLIGDVWSFEAYKTKKKTDLDLIGYFAPALDILKKYDYKLPEISNQKFNEYLKNAVESAGIDKETKKTRYVGANEIKITKPKYKFLSSHDARRTGISILLNEFNYPITHLMEITGHTDLKTLQKYINKDRQARREATGKTTPITEIMKVVHKTG